MNIKIFPSILSADFANLKEEIKKTEKAGADGLHLDIMDGHFVPNISFGPMVVQTVRRLTKLTLDAHLMIDNPHLYINDFISAGADIIVLHLESYAKESIGEKLKTDLESIKSKNKKAFVALNPGTQIDKIQPFMSIIDGVLFMSVNPGFSGQKFMPLVLDKIKTLRSTFKKDIMIDGGINAETASLATGAGANILVTASYFFGAKDYKKALHSLKS